MGLAIDLKARISDLSLADRQMVAIARAMAHQPKVLILDEPTSSLSSAEADRLFALLDRLREQGVAILYISHRMSDIRRLADRIVSMRDGVISGVFDSKPLDYEGAVNAMLGRKIHLDRIEARSSAKPILTVDALRIAPGARPFSLTLGDGEVVAITGLVGVGKTALAETLFGLRKPLSGTMTLYGKPYAPASTGEAIALVEGQADVFLDVEAADDAVFATVLGDQKHAGGACRAFQFSNAALNALLPAGRSRISASSAARRRTR